MKRYWPLLLTLGFCSYLAFGEVVIKNYQGIFVARVRGQADVNSLRKTLEELDLSYLLREFGAIACRPDSTCEISLNSNETFFVRREDQTLEAKIGDLKPSASEFKPFQSSDNRVLIWCDPNEGLLYRDAKNRGKYLRKPECYVAINIK